MRGSEHCEGVCPFLHSFPNTFCNICSSYDTTLKFNSMLLLTAPKIHSCSDDDVNIFGLIW
jgi:hypothetical protein